MDKIYPTRKKTNQRVINTNEDFRNEFFGKFAEILGIEESANGERMEEEKTARYYILVQGFRVTCLFTGQYNTKGYDIITDVI